ncbi:MAG: hypothetical protein H6736_23300 [Alphaproteobacteria bacterium]|nr:hypothetical protein [Alphaproteobacteria bacterium]MCB9694749.1 hypothetical protein [Alphaproteobacteria bacterium]
MLFVAANVALVLFAWRATPRLAPPGGPWIQALSALVLGLAALMGITMVAGFTGTLVPGVLTAGAVGLLGCWMVFDRGRPLHTAPRPSVDPVTLAAAAALGGSIGLWTAMPLGLGTDFVFDDVTYHTAVPVFWMLEHGFAYSPLTYQSYYPFDAELPGVWTLVLTGTLGSSGVGPSLAALLVALGGMALLERLETPAAPGLALAAALFVAPGMLFFAHTFSANDLFLTGWVLAALAFAAGPPARRAAVWCGLALGGALGTKVSIAPAVVLVGAWWVWRSGKDVRLPALLVVSSLLLGGSWLARNLIVTGNPLYPAAVGPFDGPLHAEAQRHTALLRFMAAHLDDSKWWWDLLGHRLDFPLPVGIAGLVGLGVAAGTGADRRRRAAWLALAVALSFLLLFPMQPYSGTVNRPTDFLHRMPRYLAMPIGVGIFLLATAFRDPRGARWATGGALVAWVWLLATGPSTPAELGFLAVGTVVGALSAVSPVLPHGARFVPHALVAVLVLGLRAPATDSGAWEHVYTFSPGARRHAQAWRKLDTLEDRRVAWISDLPSTHAFALPLYGSRWQHTVVPTDRYGEALRVPLHERWDGWDWWAPFADQEVSDDVVLGRLRAAGADTLLLSRCHKDSKGPWPAPHEALTHRTPDRLLVGSPCVELWDLGGDW